MKSGQPLSATFTVPIFHAGQNEAYSLIALAMVAKDCWACVFFRESRAIRPVTITALIKIKIIVIAMTNSTNVSAPRGDRAFIARHRVGVS